MKQWHGRGYCVGHWAIAEVKVKWKKRGGGQFAAKTTKRSISSWSSVFSVHSPVNSIDLIVIKHSISLKTRVISSILKNFERKFLFPAISAIFHGISASVKRRREGDEKSYTNISLLIIINVRFVGLRLLL